MIPRRRTESPGTYVERVLIAHGKVSTQEMARAVTTENLPAPVSPTEVERAVRGLRLKAWRIDLTEQDREGWRTYIVRDKPKPEKHSRAVRDALSEAAQIEARHWVCATCGEAPDEVPVTVLAGLGEGRCKSCRKSKAFFRHI